jgi:hypothetical protein
MSTSNTHWHSLFIFMIFLSACDTRRSEVTAHVETRLRLACDQSSIDQVLWQFFEQAKPEKQNVIAIIDVEQRTASTIVTIAGVGTDRDILSAALLEVGSFGVSHDGIISLRDDNSKERLTRPKVDPSKIITYGRPIVNVIYSTKNPEQWVVVTRIEIANTTPIFETSVVASIQIPNSDLNMLLDTPSDFQLWCTTIQPCLARGN